MQDPEPLTFVASLTDPGILPFGLQELEQVRLLVSGSSVIDWRRLAFRSLEHVDQYLKVVEIDVGEPGDKRRLGAIHRQAVNYLRGTLRYQLSHGVVEPDDVRDLFLLASQPGPAQRDACTVLKAMHIMHHVAGRELLYRLPISTEELFHRVETKVFDAVDGLKTSGISVTEFSGSRKSHESIVTKLLCRADTIAAQVHDRIRFRVVTETLDDLFRSLVYLPNALFPFNYLVPGASRNELIDFRSTLRSDPRLAAYADALQPVGGPHAETLDHENEFSARGYKIINFVVDMPVRVDDLTPSLANYRDEHGAVVFLLVEFQLLDRGTATSNSLGNNSHGLYKKRQFERVRLRLDGTVGEPRG